LHGHGTGSSARKYAQRVRCSTLPPIVARLRTWAEAACKHAEARAPARSTTSGCSPTSLRVASAPTCSSAPFWVIPRSSFSPRMSTTRSGAAMPSRNQFSSSVPPAISVAPSPASASTTEVVESARA
jgi:hypothetical protein